MSDPERRRHRRLPGLGAVVVEWAPLNRATFALANLSAGGAFLCGGPEIAIGTRVTIVLDLPLSGRFHLEATVVRLHERHDGTCDMAIAFESTPSERDRRA